MNDTIPLRTRPMTAEEVLRELMVFVVDPAAEKRIGLDTTIDEYVRHMDLLDDWGTLFPSHTRQIGRHLEASFDVRPENWNDLLLPTRQRTLRDVCKWVAAAVEVPAPEPATLMGRCCASAGTFLAVRTLLARAGADVRRLAPSSPLEPYLLRWPQVFEHPVSWLSAGRTRPQVQRSAVREDATWLLATALAVLAGWVFVTVFVGFITFAVRDGAWGLAAVGLTLAALGVVGVGWAVRHGVRQSRRLMRQLEIPGLRDFRDLVDTILNRPLRRQTPRTAP
jgi:hypothetical protein